MNKKDNNFYDLVNYIELLIQTEKNINPDIKYLDVTHSKLIAQIISNYNLQNNKNINPENPIMIFLGAPTGAGKDILVRKIMSENKEKSFVVLNMDIFRYYHNEISKNHEYISDKNFAKTTNQTSYELYYIIQKIILEKYQNTNVIVTGTIRDLNWVKNIIKTYKDNNLSHYQISLVTLAVPIVESAFSIYERYLTLVSARGNSNSPLRYTELEYHNDTVKEFIQNIKFFEDDLATNPETGLINSIKVYCRNKDIANVNENNLIFDSTNSFNSGKASDIIERIMLSNADISSARINNLSNIILNNKQYLEKQELYETIILELKKIIPDFNNSQF